MVTSDIERGAQRLDDDDEEQKHLTASRVQSLTESPGRPSPPDHRRSSRHKQKDPFHKRIRDKNSEERKKLDHCCFAFLACLKTVWHEILGCCRASKAKAVTMNETRKSRYAAVDVEAAIEAIEADIETGAETPASSKPDEPFAPPDTPMSTGLDTGSNHSGESDKAHRTAKPKPARTSKSSARALDDRDGSTADV